MVKPGDMYDLNYIEHFNDAQNYGRFFHILYTNYVGYLSFQFIF